MAEAPTKPRRVPLEYGENLLVGAMGGILETCLQMPLLTYKISVQDARPLPKTLAGWYRGVGATAASLAPITAVQVSTNGLLTKMITGGERDTTKMEKMLTASGAGVVSALIYSPVDLIVIQQQKLGLNPFQTVSHISKEYGAAMLFKGFASCCVREAVYTAGYLGIAPVCKEYMQGQSDYWKEHDLSAAIISSCIGGSIAAQITHPVDTAKTCIQGDLLKERYTSATATIPQLYNKGGIGVLYKGGGARTLRLCGAFFVINNVIEYATQLKNQYLTET